MSHSARQYIQVNYNRTILVARALSRGAYSIDTIVPLQFLKLQQRDNWEMRAKWKVKRALSHLFFFSLSLCICCCCCVFSCLISWRAADTNGLAMLAHISGTLIPAYRKSMVCTVVWLCDSHHHAIPIRICMTSIWRHTSCWSAIGCTKTPLSVILAVLPSTPAKIPNRCSSMVAVNSVTRTLASWPIHRSRYSP